MHGTVRMSGADQVNSSACHWSNGLTSTAGLNMSSPVSLFSQKPSAGCEGKGDFVELLGGTGLDPSKMMPLADLCYPFHGPGEMFL